MCSNYRGAFASIAPIRSILYADDTLIVESDAEIVQAYMNVIRELGAQYGLSFNEGKLEVLRINHSGHLYKTDGDKIKEKEAMVYLGSLLSADGKVQADLGRRIGAARWLLKG